MSAKISPEPKTIAEERPPAARRTDLYTRQGRLNWADLELEVETDLQPDQRLTEDELVAIERLLKDDLYALFESLH
jgi:hypothetical protein